MTPGPVLRCEGLHVGYRLLFGRRTVIQGLSFALRPGEITALVGANGSGKTTLFRVILGLLRPWRGSLLVGGRPPARWRVRRGIAFLAEHPVALPGWTVRDLMEWGWSRSAPGSRPDDVLEDSGLQALGHRAIDSLSRGQRREVLRCYALTGTPGLVLLDEPWSGLDSPARGRLRSSLRRLRERGATVLVSSHEFLEVREVADRVVVLDSAGPAAGAPGGDRPGRVSM